jgi:hypothetical protein
MKPIHWIVAFVQAAVLPYVVITATQMAFPPSDGTAPLVASGIFGAGCALAGFALVFDYAMGKAEVAKP